MVCFWPKWNCIVSVCIVHTKCVVPLICFTVYKKFSKKMNIHFGCASGAKDAHWWKWLNNGKDKAFLSVVKMKCSTLHWPMWHWIQTPSDPIQMWRSVQMEQILKLKTLNKQYLLTSMHTFVSWYCSIFIFFFLACTLCLENPIDESKCDSPKGSLAALAF